jgi:uncharacterized protein YyaL (SSP411 family)
MKIIFLIILLLLSSTINANQLKYENSPYLQQHKDNPLNWYPWGDEAFNKAKKENKLIFLSIGYSTCHWCHVMEEESFENKKIASFINKYFISIKVDREEKPHIDSYYQNVYNVLNGKGGGWPLSIILTPNKKAFFAATYIPNEKKYGYSGIVEIFSKVNNFFHKNPKKAIQQAIIIENALKNYENRKFKNVSLDLKIINKYINDVKKSFDEDGHGIGVSPKFPYASGIETLLDIYTLTKNKDALDMATKMLKAMAYGGIYDQIEGGFYRYSVDETWGIPHFEKMLYTNAELLTAYSKAYLITKDKFYKKIATEIVNFIKIRFENNHLLYSASDADSLLNGKKEEGAYFVFDYNETFTYLKNNKIKNIDEIFTYFNITKEGNFEHKKINIFISKEESIPKNIKKVKKLLKALRSKKTYPFIDNKILTSWNAMYISALLDGGSINKAYVKQATKQLDTLIKTIFIKNKLYHQALIGKKVKIKALLEDYAFLTQALLKAYDKTFNKKYLTLAISLNKTAINDFYENGNFNMNTGEDFKIKTPLSDGAYKSTISVMINNILKISLLTNDLGLYSKVENIIKNIKSRLSESPSSMSYLLRSFIAYEKGFIAMKAEEKNLNVNFTNYPFFIKQPSSDKIYLACKMKVCFAFSKDLENIKKAINKEAFK